MAMPQIIISLITSMIGSSILKSFPYKLQNINIKDIDIVFLLSNTSLSLVMYSIYKDILSQSYYSIISSILLLIVFIDIKYMVIPDILSISAILMTIAYKVVYHYMYGYEFLIYQAFISILIPVTLFLILSALPGDGVGAGDIILVGLLGLILGLDRVVNSLIISFTLFILTSIFMIFKKQQRIDAKLPFAPFMVIGFYIIQLVNYQLP